MEDDSKDFDLNAEFNKYVDSLVDGGDGMDSTQNEDDGDDATPNTEPTESDTSSPEESTEQTEEPEKGLPVDYQELYLKEKQRAAAHSELLSSRIKAISEQYQELRSKKDQSVFELEDDKPESLPNSVKDLLEIHPEIGEAMKEYVNMRIKSAFSKIDTAVDTKVKPLQNQLYLTEAQRHEAVIRSAHPDVSAIVESGDLLMWMNSLDPIRKAGATHVYQNGTAEEIVSLLDSYKESRGVRSKAKPKSAKPVEGNTPAYDSTEDIVKKVMAAMNVPTKKEQIDLAAPKPKKDFDPGTEFNRLVSKWEKTGMV